MLERKGDALSEEPPDPDFVFNGSTWSVKRPTVKAADLIARIEAVKREMAEIANLIDPQRDDPELECGHRLCCELDSAIAGMDETITAIKKHTEEDGTIVVGEWPVEAMARLDAWIDRRCGIMKK